MATATGRADGTRTPSPPVVSAESCSAMEISRNSGGTDVPSPVPASVSSTTSSDQSQGNNNNSSNNNNNNSIGSSGGISVAPVPNPFAVSNAPPATVSMTHTGWGNQAYENGAGTSSTYPPQKQQPAASIPSVVSAPAPAPSSSFPTRSVSSNAWARNDSCPNFSIGTTDPESPGVSSARGLKGAARRRYNKVSSIGSNNDDSGENGGPDGTVNSRRQKRLERNRESARLSRRRRKQYLEVLEDRVTQLSTEVDQGRRAHAAEAVTITLLKRREVLESLDKTDEERSKLLEHGLGRTSPEMMLLNTFKHQQLKSFSLPAQNKFILWLTLQNDQYFRGGRAASERLSAARIGERMLNSGNDRVPPATSMWPLFCNEVGLSYDQEERVRNFQRTLLQCHDSWLERHTARAADLAMASVHDSTQAMTLRLGQRERTMLSILTPTQKIKFLSWAEKNKEKLHHFMGSRVKKQMENVKSPMIDERFKVDKKQHIAANLYILNHRLQKILQTIPRAAPLVTGLTLKKLSRRPSFESLGRSPLEKHGEEGQGGLSREHSFASSGSLKRSASMLSMDGDRPQLLQISPDDAEETCKPSVDKVLGYLKEIIPSSPPPPPPVPHSSAPSCAQNQQSLPPSHLRMPSPTHVTSAAPYHSHPTLQPQYAQQPPSHYQHAIPVNVVSSHPPTSAHPAKMHKKQSSFIPPYLNVVPEEMFPNDGTADEFLMSLVDEDWAIGEGVDMDTAS